jgi:hypothetical protein
MARAADEREALKIMLPLLAIRHRYRIGPGKT